MRNHVLALTLLFSIAAPTLAGHCVTWSTTTPTMTVGDIYLINECPAPNCDGFSIWIYAESNHYPGLQRGDDVSDDTCHGMIAPDTIIF